MENILLAAGVIGLVVVAVTSLIKSSIPNNKYLPLINVVVGVILGVAYAASFAQADIVLYGWGGFIAGLAAGGFYDLGAGFIKDSTKQK